MITELLNIDWVSVLNVVLRFIGGLDFGNPLVFWGTSPLWAFPVTWVIYVAVMNIKRVRDSGVKLHPATLAFCLVAAVIGGVLDFYLNVILFTVLSLQLPKQWTVSKRLQTYHRLPAPPTNWRERWRYALASWVCGNLLSPFDPSGEHC